MNLQFEESTEIKIQLKFEVRKTFLFCYCFDEEIILSWRTLHKLGDQFLSPQVEAIKAMAVAKKRLVKFALRQFICSA